MTLMEVFRRFEEPVQIRRRGARSAKEQVANGLRLGFGCGIFFISFMLMTAGFTRLIWSNSGTRVVGSDWIGWLELSTATILLLASAHVWHLLVGAYLLFGFFKAALVLFTGQYLYPPHQPVARTQAAELMLFALGGLVLLFRMFEIRLSFADRAALTIFVLVLVSGQMNASASIVGLAVLALAWCIAWAAKSDRRKQTQEASAGR